MATIRGPYISGTVVYRGGARAVALRNLLYIRILTPLVAALPAWLAYGLALLYADTRIRLDKPRFQEVLTGLEHVTGMTQSCGSETARRYFRSKACLRVDVMRLTGDGHRLMQLVTIKGEEYIAQALRERKGAILCSAHYGSGRACAGLLAAKGYPITMIAEWAFPKDRSPDSKTIRLIQLWWKSMEHHFRRPNIMVFGDTLDTAVQAADLLRQNELVFTMVDAAAKREDLGRAVSPSFLGVPVNILPGPAVIARLTGAPILMTFLRRTRDWRHLELEVRPMTSLGRNDLSTMQQCVSEVEGVVRSDPAQWELWRMKNLVRLGLYPEELAREFYSNNGWDWNEW